MEHERNRGFIQFLPSHIGDDTDNSFPRSVGAGIQTVLEPLAQRILARPIPSRHFLIDHDDPRSALSQVRVLEKSALDEWNPHRLEVSRHDLILRQRRRRVFGTGRRAALERNSIIRLPVDKEIADCTGSHYPGQRSDTLHSFRIKRGHLRTILVNGRQIDLQQQHVAGIETAIGCLHALKAPNQKSSAGQQNDRESNLSHNQALVQALLLRLSEVRGPASLNASPGPETES